MAEFGTFVYSEKRYGLVIDATSVDVLSSQMIEIEFADELVVDDSYLNPEAYTVSVVDGSGPVNVRRVFPVNTNSSLNVILITDYMTDGTHYRVSFGDLKTRSGIRVTGSGDFISRKTKLDFTLGSIPQHFDKKPESNIVSLLAAVAKEDDTIGGSRKDRFQYGDLPLSLLNDPPTVSITTSTFVYPGNDLSGVYSNADRVSVYAAGNPAGDAELVSDTWSLDLTSAPKFDLVSDTEDDSKVDFKALAIGSGTVEDSKELIALHNTPYIHETNGTFTRNDSAAFRTNGGAELSYAGVDVLRREELGDGEGDEVLIEGTRTNLITHSQEFDNTSSWTTGGVVVTPNTHTALDGTQTADTVEDSDASGLSQIYQVVNISSAGLYTVSFYVLKDSSSSVVSRISVLNDGSVLAADFDENSGNAQAVTTSSAVSESVGDWWRFSFKLNLNVDSTTLFRIFPARSSSLGGTSDASLTNALVVWGFQVEEGEFPSSYIKTDSSSENRVKDTLVVSASDVSSNYWDGKWAIDVWPKYGSDELSTGIFTILSSDFGTGTADEIRLLGSTKRFELVHNGSVQANTPVVSWSRNQKLTLVVDLQNGSIELSGATTGNGSDTVAGSPIVWDVSDVRIGGSLNQLREFFGRISYVREVP